MSLNPNRVNENSDEFHDVELAVANSGGPSFFIENSSFKGVLQTVGALFLFIAVHIFAAWRAPGIISFDQQYYPLNQTDPNSSIDVDVTLNSLLNEHRFVHVNGSLVRNTSIDTERTVPVEISTRFVYSKNSSIINSENIDKIEVKLNFPSQSTTSSDFPVVHKDINDYDTLQVKMTISADLSGVSGFRFTWSYGNPSGLKYSVSARVLMSFLVGYMLIIFFNALHFTNESFTQIFTIVVAFSGIFSSNPVSIFFPSSKTCRIIDQLLLAAFVALFRMFILCQFEMIRGHKTSPGIFPCIIFALYVSLHATVSATAGYDRLTFVQTAIDAVTTVLPSESYQVYATFAFAGITIIWIVLALVQSNGYATRRLYYFILIACILIIADLFSHVFCVLTGALQYTILPSMCHISLYMTTAAFTIFMMHAGGGQEYTQMQGDKDAGVLDVEQMTDDELDDSLNDEEEEAEEEEEEEE